jgi:hypothetical protein
MIKIIILTVQRKVENIKSINTSIKKNINVVEAEVKKKILSVLKNSNDQKVNLQLKKEGNIINKKSI